VPSIRKLALQPPIRPKQLAIIVIVYGALSFVLVKQQIVPPEQAYIVSVERG
jgi:hypothetical protein